MVALLEVTINALTALVFATAAVGKLRHAETFEGVVANFRILPEPLVRPFARALPWAELAVAVLVWAPGVVGAAAQAAGAALMVVFAIAMAINVGRGRRIIDCGCFKTEGRQPLGWPMVLRNLVFAGALALAAGLDGGRLDALVWSNGLAAGVALFLLYLAAGELAALRSRVQSKTEGLRT